MGLVCLAAAVPQCERAAVTVFRNYGCGMRAVGLLGAISGVGQACELPFSYDTTVQKATMVPKRCGDMHSHLFVHSHLIVPWPLVFACLAGTEERRVMCAVQG